MELFRNGYFCLTAEGETVYITVFAQQFPLKDFELVLRQVPRVQVTNFSALRSAVLQKTNTPVEIGIMKPDIEIEVSKDDMQASFKLNLPAEELQTHKAAIVNRIMDQLKLAGVVDGILYEVISSDFPVQKSVVVARGIPPLPGEDASVTYFSLSERKPTIREDGRADYYEISFIDEVQAGDWLGEKVPATPGTPGRNLKGVPIPPQKGRDKPLIYDKQSISEHEENGSIVLRSKITGAVQKLQNKISVQELLVINGDVGPKTGNIDYDGSIKIKGTIHDGYSVTATKDISIQDEMGLGAVESIVSKTGDIFIKGGIFGKGRATIQAGRNVFVKNAQDCSITAGDNIHIGLYAIGCNLQAKYILLDKRRGKIIGGHVQAKVQIVTAFIGNESERPTKVHVEGFDRREVMKDLELVLQEYKKVLAELEHLRKEVDLYEEYVDMLKNSEMKAYMTHMAKFEEATMKVANLEERRKRLMTNLNTKGDGEVTVLQKAFPRTLLQIKEIEKRIEQITTGSFYVDKNTFFHS
ncbi:DUF342 domain-containing protein [Paenibacillus thalictri]|uniref:DUF342 domain-containing protein n=1 Tax=Paenibacillus thalictri TaxID=2527873 RepID=A0A4Q9DWU6_9BACL|nr:FapA family protein [Paenibacillus thalictri]TBL81529.1 DUF342 domain-containing protein [Paenibacillus thalictri]